MRYKNGVRDGAYQRYDIDGMHLINKCYKNGREIDVRRCGFIWEDIKEMSKIIETDHKKSEIN